MWAATTTTTTTATDSRHQHTLHYKAGILKQKKIEKEMLVRARNEEILASMQKTDQSKTFVDVEKVDDERVDVKKADAENVEAENFETERDVSENSAIEKVDFQKVDIEKVETERADTERIVAVKVNSEKAVVEKTDSEKADAENVDFEKVDTEKVDETKTLVESAEEETKNEIEAGILSENEETAEAENVTKTNGDATCDVIEATCDVIDAPADDIDECDAQVVAGGDAAFADEEIELTFDMTKTKLQEIPVTHDADETLEDTYASLGVTFLELTSQMQNVLKEVTTCHETFTAATEDDENDGKLVDKDDLPFIDDVDHDADADDAKAIVGAAAEVEAELDAAIVSAAPHLDHDGHVTSIQVGALELLSPCLLSYPLK